MGRRRHPRPRAHVPRRPAAARRPAAPLPRRRRVHQVPAGRTRRRRPVRPTVRGVPGPHRPAQGRIPRPHSRFRRADRRRVLVARAARANCAPTATSRCIPNSRISSTPGSPPDPPACAAATCSSSTANASAKAASIGQSPKPRKPLASAMFRPTASVIPWRPKRSTAA